MYPNNITYKVSANLCRFVASMFIVGMAIALALKRISKKGCVHWKSFQDCENLRWFDMELGLDDARDDDDFSDSQVSAWPRPPAKGQDPGGPP
nr:hypothetical protein [Tanacetum cinerariifolium]